MDPTAALREIRSLMERIANGDATQRADLALGLAERVNNLDMWMSKGGFPPADWSNR